MLARSAAYHLSIACVERCADSRENWPQWRGPSNNGVSSETGLPTKWSATRKRSLAIATARSCRIDADCVGEENLSHVRRRQRSGAACAARPTARNFGSESSAPATRRSIATREIPPRHLPAPTASTFGPTWAAAIWRATTWRGMKFGNSTCKIATASSKFSGAWPPRRCWTAIGCICR